MPQGADDERIKQRQTDWQPPAIETPEGPEFEIEEIRGERTYQRKKQYLIKWVGWAEPTWNDMSLLQEVKALNAWEASQQAKLGVKRALNSHKGPQQRGRRGPSFACAHVIMLREFA
ncbi:hypothetical protein ACO22_05213 [Paracoccidioides brasiliensis]|uniref:Chromo domain-containing protein n=1 Tax=Paracoccidioides brasiliensis TaxID=121759 RepID=A0A1D2J3M1_PARBR|nr:hypothetical protein ACO22_07946 [Paracoccidioides brasiliensis]ODH25597.1 hypothetical protein ACO22_05213 [Paracoccidioides brasiliensis]